MEHVHGSYESTSRFRINPFSRQIINESEIEIVIAQYDHNSERFIFELPKIVDEHDMTSCSKIRIHYINTGGSGKVNKDVYEVADLAISEEDPDTVTFSWRISKGATALDGVLSFSIQFICTTDGEVDYSWNTLPFKAIKVPATYDNSEDIIIEDYSDILEQWKEELFASLDVSVHDYYTKGEVYTKEETVSIVNAAVSDLIDSSPESLDTLNELSKALGDDPNFASTTLELIGKKANSEDVNAELKKKANSEDVNAELKKKANSEDVNAELKKKADKKSVANAHIKEASGRVISLSDVSPIEHELDIKVSNGSGMLYRRNKNFISMPYASNITNYGGFTRTELDGGGLQISGISTGEHTGHTLATDLYLPVGTYTLSMPNTFKTVSCKVSIHIIDYTNSTTICAVSMDVPVKTFTIYSDIVSARIAIDFGTLTSGVSSIDGCIYPQLELGTSATEFEKGIVQTYTPDDNGDITGVNSLYPNVILYTNSTDALVNAIYNVDINKHMATKDSIDALKKSASGEFVRVDDVSAAQHKVAARVNGKNLIPYPFKDTTKTLNGLTFTDNEDGSITIDGTATAASTFSVNSRFSVASAGVYTLSGCPEGGSGSKYMLAINYYIDNVETTGVRDTGNGHSISLSENTDVKIYIYVANGHTISNLTFYPQLELGDTATEYEPYVDPTTITVTRCGKNIAKPSKSDQTTNGYTVKANFDGTVTITGAAIASVDTVLDIAFRNTDGTRLNANCSYRLSAWKDGKQISVGARSLLSDGSYEYGFATVRDYERTIVKVYIQFTPEIGDTSQCGTYKVQVESGNDITDYEPYNGVTYISASDGTVEIDPIAPTMTILADKPGANIDVKYNRDINKAFEELYQAIISLGGNI